MVWAMHLFASLLRKNRPLFLLAPLASLSHRGLREMIMQHGGCDLFFSEMISAIALVSNTNYESYYLDAGPDHARLIYQLVGAETELLTQAAIRLIAHAERHEQVTGQPGCAGIDLNMGCSAPEMVRQGAGVYWMTQTEAARQLVASIRPHIPANKSLSAKIRIGEDADWERLRGFCLGLQDEGLDFITFHPRLRKDPWSRPARWQWFSRLANELTIPLIANGDIRDKASIDLLGATWRSNQATEKTCDWPAGIMIGRAAVKCPWIFRQLSDHIHRPFNQTKPESSIDYMQEAQSFHTNLELWQPQDFWLTRAKRFYGFFGQNLVFGNRVAAQIQSIACYADILPFFENYLKQNPAERYPV